MTLVCALVIIYIVHIRAKDKCAAERQLCACQNQLIIQIERAESHRSATAPARAAGAPRALRTLRHQLLARVVPT